ncbi:MAG: hypothetical protein KU38_09730 [Sulfurovum sp. FS08-3]|nr:MAG: hypothetical protein KU38_09730 [Sulfurovum sp. FS08-3]
MHHRSFALIKQLYHKSPIVFFDNLIMFGFLASHPFLHIPVGATLREPKPIPVQGQPQGIAPTIFQNLFRSLGIS